MAAFAALVKGSVIVGQRTRTGDRLFRTRRGCWPGNAGEGKAGAGGGAIGRSCDCWKTATGFMAGRQPICGGASFVRLKMPASTIPGPGVPVKFSAMFDHI